MKITAISYDIQIEIKIDENNVIVIENPILFREFILELKELIAGKECEIIISQNEKITKAKENMDILISPLDIDLSGKKVINKLYSSLKEKAYDEEHYEKTMKLQSDILKYLYELESDSEYILSINDMDVLGIFKSFGVEIEDSEELIEKLDGYIKIISRLLKCKILVLINFSSYFSQDEISMIQKTAMYEDIRLLFIEACDRIESNNKIIIDEDQCRIL